MDETVEQALKGLSVGRTDAMEPGAVLLQGVDPVQNQHVQVALFTLLGMLANPVSGVIIDAQGYQPVFGLVIIPDPVIASYCVRGMILLTLVRKAELLRATHEIEVD